MPVAGLKAELPLDLANDLSDISDRVGISLNLVSEEKTMDVASVIAFQFAQSIRPSAPTPPPGGNIENRQPPPEPQKPTSTQQGTNLGNLQLLQEILGSFRDVADADTEQRGNVDSRFRAAGLLEPGALFDVRV